MRVLLLSTYDLGRQPFGLASPARWLRDAGFEVTVRDLSRQRLEPADVSGTALAGVFLPMHTATRLALPVIGALRAGNPGLRICAYGLYAPLCAARLGAAGVDWILDGEFEADLVECARLVDGQIDAWAAPRTHVPARLTLRVPDRSGLPPLTAYAALARDAERRVVGYTEASRGCKHGCRHCPVVPVYDGRFRVVPREVVLADVEQQVAAGARHITFGDPDFFNGIRHAEEVVGEFARRFPGVSFDVTVKVEHLRRHAASLPRLRDAGCAFVTTAVESFDDHVLERLDKRHTRDDVWRVAEDCNRLGLPLAPTFVAFTPWTSLDSYTAFLDEIERLEWIDAVAPIQLALRLLLPEGSRLLALDEIRARTRAFDARSLTFTWVHDRPEVDRLAAEVEHLVGRRIAAPRREAFARVRALVDDHRGSTSTRPASRAPAPARATIPYLTEPWYC